MWGARTVLTVAPLAVARAPTSSARSLGLLAGYYGGWIDIVITRVCDIVLSFPVIILYMIILIANSARRRSTSSLAITLTRRRASPASCAA